MDLGFRVVLSGDLRGERFRVEIFDCAGRGVLVVVEILSLG